MTETMLAPTPALLVAPRAVRLVNPRLTQLAEMALFDEPLASAPAPSASPSPSEGGRASSTGSSRADEGQCADDAAPAPRSAAAYSPFSL